MHPQPPATGEAPAPADPMASLAAHLDSVMEEAALAANTQRDVEAEEAGNPTPPSARQEAPPTVAEGEDTPPADDEEPDEESQDESEETDDETEDEEDEGEEPAPAPAPAEQPKYSRRDAARFATELEQSKRELEQARSELASHRGEISAFKASDQTIRKHLQQQSGYVTEQNGRFRYENLSEKVLKGTATVEEAEEVTQMTQWHEFAAPIFRAAQEMQDRALVADWSTIRGLEGVGDEGLKKLNAVTQVPAAMRELHTMAFTAGEAKGKQESEAKIARLQAQVKSLKTGAVARSPQPASSNGAAVPGPTGIIARMIDPATGLPNPDFDREVAAGKWIGVDLANS